jgi:hypothetical protein
MTLQESSLILAGDDESTLELHAGDSEYGPSIAFSSKGALYGPNKTCGFKFEGGTSTDLLSYTATLDAWTDGDTGKCKITLNRAAVTRMRFSVKITGLDKPFNPFADPTTLEITGDITVESGSSSSEEQLINSEWDWDEISKYVITDGSCDGIQNETGKNTATLSFKVRSYSSGIVKSLGSIVPKSGLDYNLGASGNSWAYGYFNNVIYSTSCQKSDRKAKNTINYDISKYDDIFDALKPATYLYNEGTSRRTHLGFIAQDIQTAIEQSNMTTKECSIVTIDGEGFDKLQGKVIDEENAHYYINPNELHALEVRQIQLLKAQVKQQAKEIAELKQLVKDLTTK